MDIETLFDRIIYNFERNWIPDHLSYNDAETQMIQVLEYLNGDITSISVELHNLWLDTCYAASTYAVAAELVSKALSLGYCGVKDIEGLYHAVHSHLQDPMYIGDTATIELGWVHHKNQDLLRAIQDTKSPKQFEHSYCSLVSAQTPNRTAS